MRSQHAIEMTAVQSKLSESLELQGYYQKMAEDYRSKFLQLEQDHQVLKQTHDLDIEKLAQLHEKETANLSDRLQFEQGEANRRLEQAVTERDNQIDHLIEDNKLLQQRLMEEDRTQIQLREQIKQLASENHRQLDDIAAIKREKELDLEQARKDFRIEKDTILEKAQQER